MSATTMPAPDPIKSASKPQSQQQQHALRSSSSTAASGSTSSSLSSNHKVLETTRKQTSSPVDGPSRKPPQQQPRAWQSGHNPITQRSSSAASANGAERPTGSSSASSYSQSAVKTPADPSPEKHAHDRALFLLAHFIGKDATITMKNGEQFTGVFSGGSFEQAPTHYTIKMARRTRPPDNVSANGHSASSTEYIGQGEDHVLAIDVQDTADLFVPEVTINTTTSLQNGAVKPAFLTDTQISSRDLPLPMERQLQPWTADADTDVDMSLEGPGAAGWDQFAINSAKFGVSTDYDENIYTTTINRDNPQYRRQQAEADRIAREIEGSAPSNAHVAEERLQNTWHEDGIGEEEKYSGVRRDITPLPKRSDNAYIPPSRRTGASSQAPPAPTTNTPLTDPAIISSQLKANTPSSQVADQAGTRASEQPPPLHSTHTAPAIAPSAGDASAASSSTVTASTSIPKRPKESTTEDHVRGTADAFKQFANNEKMRIRQAQESRRSNLRQEKNVKLNDLKKFAANFKLKSRVPDDLVPILAKDREKQREIQTKAEEAAIEEEQRKKEKESDKGSSVVSPTATTPAVASTGPAATTAHRNQFPTQPRSRPTAQMRQTGMLPGPGQPGSRGHAGPQRGSHHGPQGPFYGRHPFPQPLPADLRMPTAAPSSFVAPADAPPQSPANAPRLNVNARPFELRAGASWFNPSGPSPSPQRSIDPNTGLEPSRPQTPAAFFDKAKTKQAQDVASTFDALKRIKDAKYTDQQKKNYALNGGIPNAYNTAPTWAATEQNDKVVYLSLFPKPRAPSQGTSPMPVPHLNGHMQPMPPQHIPGAGGSAASTPQRGHFFPAGTPHGPTLGFDPRLQPHFGPNGSVHNSPRAQHMHAAPFNGQMPMPQYPGQQPPPTQPPQQPPMSGFGMSPSMPYRQMQAPGAPMMMMMPGQPQGQMRQIYHQPPQYPGGHMMVQQPSGGYPNGPIPQQNYSPMPPHAQPHMQHHLPPGPPPGPNGPPPPSSYQGSPRPPPMMQHQGSHQGYNPQQMHPGMQQPGQGQPPFNPAGPPIPFHLQQQQQQQQSHPQQQHSHQHQHPHHNPHQHQQRTMSAAHYQHVAGNNAVNANVNTPRQHHAAPNHTQSPSVGNVGPGSNAAGAQAGEEGK